MYLQYINLKKELCDEHIIPRKCKEKLKCKDKRIFSTVIFIEEVNNYYERIDKETD